MKTGLQRQRGQVLKELKRAGSDKATDDKVWVVEGGKVGRRWEGEGGKGEGRRWEGEGGKVGERVHISPRRLLPLLTGRRWVDNGHLPN